MSNYLKTLSQNRNIQIAFHILQSKAPDFMSRSDYQFDRLMGYQLSGINSIKHWWHLILRLFLSPSSLRYQRLEMCYLPHRYTKSYREERRCDLLVESTSHSQLLKREMHINPKCPSISNTCAVICPPPPRVLGETDGVSPAANRGTDGNVDGRNLRILTLFSSVSDRIFQESAHDEDQIW